VGKERKKAEFFTITTQRKAGRKGGGKRKRSCGGRELEGKDVGVPLLHILAERKKKKREERSLGLFFPLWGGGGKEKGESLDKGKRNGSLFCSQPAKKKEENPANF